MALYSDEKEIVNTSEKNEVTVQAILPFGFYAPKGLRTLAQGWRTRLPWVRQERNPTPKGLRRMLDIVLKVNKSNSRRNPLGVGIQKNLTQGRRVRQPWAV